MQLIITRKIEVFICEDDKDLRNQYYDKLYRLRDIARDAANAASSHLFMLDNTIPYLDEDSKKLIRFIGTKGTPASRQNAAYCLMSKLFKDEGKCMDMLSNLAQYVSKNYKEDRKHGTWKRSLRSYKSSIPMPYQKKSFQNLRFCEYTDGEGNTKTGCFFSLSGIPFQMRFGRDRSNNRVIVERVVSGEYKMCTSSIKCDGKKIFLLLCVEIPKEEPKLDENKRMYAFLGVMNPIVYHIVNIKHCSKIDDYGKIYTIGSKEEFNYRRRQIQEAVKRCQEDNRYSAGGRGRKKKCKAIDRWHDVENNYVYTKLHTYSRMLVDAAVKNKCSEIILMNQIHREDEAKMQNANGDNFVLRNWTYYGLKDKIGYKCDRYGVKLSVEK